MELETPRLILREFRHADFGAVHAYGSDPVVTRYVSFGPNSPTETEDFLTRAIGASLAEPRKSYDLAIVTKGEGDLIGGVGLHLGGHGHTGGCGAATPLRGELGYVLRPDAWGHGYAAEAGAALVAYGFGNLGLRRVFAECHAANQASEKVMLKIGMRREGVLRQHALIKGEWWDVVVCGILREDWAAP